MSENGSTAGDLAPTGLREEITSLRKGQKLWVGVFGSLFIALAVQMIWIFRFEIEYIILAILVGALYIAAGSLIYSRKRIFRRIAVRIELENRRLEETDLASRRANVELQTRIDNDNAERERQQWVDAATRSISLQIKSAVVPEKIAETVVEGLGRELGVDIVLFYSFPKYPMPRLWKQWHRHPDVLVEESVVIENETGLMTLAESLWKKERSIIVNDSEQVNIPRDLVPKITATAQGRTRSWVMVPFGAGPEVMGCVGVGMAEEVRVWSAAELELIKHVVADTANIFIHARMFDQMMQLAENDAEIIRMAELDKAKNDFIENMNHELRSPLTSIIGYVEMIIGDIGPTAGPEIFESLAIVQRNAIRLKSLIANMMQISKTDFENLPLDILTVDIGNLLSDAFKSMNLDADNKGVELTLLLDSLPDKLLIDGDSNRLQQVFVNLLSNAIKYTLRGGTVTAIARRVGTEIQDDHYVEVTITDTGIGIPTEEFPKIFTRFFRASTATQPSIPGFGIGLSLAHSIVTEHHGTITFDSTVGKGTVFTVKLPTRFVSTESPDSSQPSPSVLQN